MSSRREQSLEILSSVEHRGDRFNELLKRVAAQDAEIKPDVSLSSWIFFSFKPYVFPKDDAGREVTAPIWFKYLGRTLIGLIIAILLTKQLNIWKQLSALYLNFLGALKRSHHLGDDEELRQQRAEMLLGLRAMFFLLENVIDRFHYLPYGLGIVLAFIGVKMVLAEGIGGAGLYAMGVPAHPVLDPYHVPINLSLGLVALVLVSSVLASLLLPAPSED